MLIDNLNTLFYVFGVTILFLIIFYLGYGKYLLSIFDPLFIFLLTMAFTSTLVVNVVSDAKYIALFFICQSTFCAGFRLSSEYCISRTVTETFLPSFQSKRLLQIITIIGIAIYAVANLYMISQVGITLFQENPSIAKVASFSGGLGIVRRINWGLGNFLAVCTIMCLFISRRKFLFIVILLIEMTFTMLNGSKSGIISFLTIFVLISAIKGLDSTSLMKRAKKMLPLMLGASIAIGIYILFKESNSLESAFFGFATRLLYAGDVAFYYYTPIILKFYSSFNFLDYILHELNPILGMFRLAEYSEPFGSQMLMLSLPKYVDFGAIIGPNTPFYVKGHIFFGDFGCWIYAFFAGSLIGYFRYKFLTVTSGRLILKVFLLSISNIIFLYATESNLLIGQVFDTIFFVLPTVFIALVIFEGLFNIKNTQLKYS